MAGSLPAAEIERAVMAGVRAALQSTFPSQPLTPLTVSGLQGNSQMLPAVPTGVAGRFPTAVTSQRSAPLPSIPRRNGAQSRYSRRRNVKTYTKEVVCLPFSPEESVFLIPRGETRTKLAQAGLLGKISFSTEWSEDQLRAEITAIFRGAFGLSEHQSFPFQFLSTIKGCKKLMIPQVTSNFPWGGKEVASVCSSTCLYIMAGMEAPIQNGHLEISDDSDFESPVLQRRRVSQSDGPLTRQREQHEREDDDKASLPAGDEVEFIGHQRPNEPHIHFADFIPIDVEDDEAIEEAIRLSLLNETVQSSQDSRFQKTLSKEEIIGIVKAHSESVVTTAYRPIFISRANVWSSALRQFSRHRFADSTDFLYVTFASDEDINEEAEDLGGPRREFFRLLVKAIYKDSGAFEETPNGFIPRMNISYAQNGVYRTIGQMMSTIIVQGGEPPALLSPLVADYFLTENIFEVQVTPEDVADMELRGSLKRVEQAENEADLAQAVECCDSWRYQVEGLPNPVNMDNKDAFVKSGVLLHVLIQRKSCYDQLAEGLKYYGVLPLLKENPPIRILLDMPKEPSDVTANVVAAILKPSYSVLGSNRRPREELMVVKFREFLYSVQEKEFEEHLSSRNLTEAEKAFIQTLNPGHILAFATGSGKVPAVGFHPSPKLTFVHDDTKHLPIAHTCSNEIQIFVNTKMLADDDEFEYHILVALMNGAIFSAV